MIANESEPSDEQFTDLLAAYDDALAAGETPEGAATLVGGPDLRPRLERGVACLHLLRTLLPGGGSPRESLPAVLGRFQIRRELGHGSFGRVFLAFDPRLGREIALKVPRPETLGSPDQRQRFRREARAAAGLDHPHIVPVYEAGEEAGVCYIASAYCPGPTLAAWLKERQDPVPVESAAELLAALAEAVEHAHSRGVLHRDLKPSNVLLAGVRGPGAGVRQGEDAGARAQSPDPWPLNPLPKITDFGLAKLLGVEPGASGSDAACETQSGAILGTPHYMAPEQAAGQVHMVGPAADVYALGAILYELLTGRPPFQGDLLDMLEQVRSQEPVPLSRLRPKLPRDLQTVCLKCLEKEPKRRYASAAALAEDLRRFLNGEPIRARRAGGMEKALKWVRRRPATAALLATSGLAALALAAGGVAWWYNGRLQEAFAEADRLRERAVEFEAAVRYAHDMNTAQRAWEAAAIPQMNQLLDTWEPGVHQPRDLRGWEHFYLRSLCHRELNTLPSINPVDLTFSPNGRWLAAASSGKNRGDPALEIWETSGWRTVHLLSDFKGPLHRVAFSPDSRWLATAGRNQPVVIWDPVTGKKLRAVTGETGPEVRGLAFSPDGRWLAVGGEDRVTTLWETGAWEPTRALRGHTGPIERVAFSPDSRRLASVGQDCTVRLWHVGTGKVDREWVGHKFPIHTVAFSADGKLLATGGEDCQLKLWDAESGQELATLEGSKFWVHSVAFEPGGRHLASTSDDGVVRLWNCMTHQEVAEFRGHERNYVSCSAFSPDGRILASGCADGTVKLWDPMVKLWAPANRSPQEYRVIPVTPLWDAPPIGHDFTFAPDGKSAATTGQDGVVRLLDTSTWREVVKFQGQKGWGWAVAFRDDGRLLACAGADQTVTLWDLTTQKQAGCFAQHQAPVTSVVFSPDGLHIASHSEDGTVHYWEIETGKAIYTFSGCLGGSHVLAFRPDGRWLASPGPDNAVRVWDVGSGKKIFTFRGHTDELSCLAFSPDGRRLASASRDTTVRLWDLGTGSEGAVYRGHHIQVLCLAFSPDGRRLATASDDQTVRLWDPETGLETLTLTRRGGLVFGGFYALAFSPDGDQLAAYGAPSLIFLWEAPRR
jgi:WD40 repeat protein